MPRPARRVSAPFESFVCPAELEFAAAEGDSGLKKFNMTAYTGGPMRIRGYPYPVVIDLATCRVPPTVAILRDHDPGRVVGHAMGSDVLVTPQRVKASGVVSGTGPDAVEVVENAANKFPWQASVGGPPPDSILFVDRGEKATVNGRVITGPKYILGGALIREISVTSLGADGNTSTSVAAGIYLEDGPMKWTEWLAASKIDEAGLTPEVKAALETAYKAEMALEEAPPVKEPAKDPPKITATAKTPEEIADDAVKLANTKFAANAERIDKIQELAADHPKIAAQAIRDGWDVTKTELEVMRAGRGTVAAAATGHKGNIDAQVLTCALCIAAGVPADSLGKQYTPEVMNKAMEKDFQGASLHTLMNQTIVAATGSGYGGVTYKSNSFIKEAQRCDKIVQARMADEPNIQASGGFSTLSLSNVLEAVANKAMIARYMQQEVTWPAFCGIRSHNDFKIHNRYQLNGLGSFKKVGPDGELKHIGLSDAKFTNQVETYGAMIGLTRQMQYNDDMGAFLEIPNIMGEQSAIRQEEAAYVLLLSLINSTSGFHTNNKNYLTGAGSALSIAGVTAARQKFVNRVNANSKPILIQPKLLLTGSGGNLADLATDFYTQNEFAITTTADTPKSAKNPHQGKYKPVQAPYISNTDILDQDGNAISGQTSTGWGLFADPAVRSLVAMAFLNGQRMPIIEKQDAPFDVLGMLWRGYCDFGLGVEDVNAAVWNAGV